MTESVRQLTLNVKAVPDWAAFVAMGESFTTTTSYDALGRVVQIDTPHNTNIPASQVLPIYNEANLLNQVDVKLRGSVTATTFVSNIDYDAKGQRQRIQYGNGSTTRYDHDPLTYRLTRLLTTRNSGADTLQDLDYTYDPSGNVVQITDAAQQTVFFNNAVVNPTALYEYDALYRLTKATGREHVSNGATTEPEAEGFNPAQALPGDGAALRNYTRQWSYDQVGNILSLIHTANAGSWNRSYAYATDSNRLSTTTVGQTTDSYSHNAFGSFTTMPHLDVLDWDHNEHLSHVKRGTSETWYIYDSAGQRVRKLTEKPGQSEERIYLGGFEIYRKSQGGSVTLERETLHIMDGVKRIALVETRTVGTDSSSPQTIRYQLDNHLQSATLELDETAALISYEEYYPYGDTSYQSGRDATEVQRKRYRYTGKEKDEETGLYYHGARYYAGWLGRWTAADPSGIADGPNLYAYVRNHPTGLVDPDGKAGETTSFFAADNTRVVTQRPKLNFWEQLARQKRSNRTPTLSWQQAPSKEERAYFDQWKASSRASIAIEEHSIDMGGSQLMATLTGVVHLSKGQDPVDVLPHVQLVGAAEAALGAIGLAKISADADKSSRYVDTKEYARGASLEPISRTLPKPGSLSAEQANAQHVDKGDNPPYAEKTRAREITLTDARKFVRVHGEHNQAGNWIMRIEDIKGLSAEEIKDKYALPNLPRYISDVNRLLKKECAAI